MQIMLDSLPNTYSKTKGHLAKVWWWVIISATLSTQDSEQSLFVLPHSGTNLERSSYGSNAVKRCKKPSKVEQIVHVWQQIHHYFTCARLWDEKLQERERYQWCTVVCIHPTRVPVSEIPSKAYIPAGSAHVIVLCAPIRILTMQIEGLIIKIRK